MGWFGRSKPKPQEIAVLEGGDNAERQMKQAAAQVQRWAKVMETYQNAQNDADKARYAKAVAWHAHWSALASAAALKPED